MSSTFEESDAVIGQRIQSIRSQKGMSQADFAEALGISLRAYQNYERGERPVSKQLLCALKEAFGTSSDFILNGKQETELSAPTNHLVTMASSSEMAALLHCIFEELDDELMLRERMSEPDEDAFWFLASVYNKVVKFLPDTGFIDSTEARELVRHFAKEEVESYNRILEIAHKNDQKRAEAAGEKAARATGATQTFHSSVGQVGGGDINNFGDKEK